MPDSDKQDPIVPSLEELNSLISGYTFTDLISEDGTVYLAQQESPERNVAIKVLPSALGENADFMGAFAAEFQSISELKQSNLIKMYDFGNANGVSYIVMEYVNGKSLEHSNIGTIVEPKTAVDIIAGVCKGLEFAHQADILHLDVKPSNIILNKLAVPKIGDFVLARLSDLMQTGAMSSTPHYSAPEISDDPEKIGPRADLFSVGVIFYELLTGTKPEKDYQSVTTFAMIDAGFDDIIQKAIHPDVEQRYESTGEFAAVLKKMIEPSKRPSLSMDTMRVSLVASEELSSATMAATLAKSSNKIKDITAATSPIPLSASRPSSLTSSQPVTATKTTDSPPADTEPTASASETANNRPPKNIGLIIFIIASLILVGAYFLSKHLNENTDGKDTEQSSESSFTNS